MALVGFGDRVEGFHAVAAAVAAGRVMELRVEASRARRSEVMALISSAEERGALIQVVDDVSREAETAVPQGLVARARPIPFRSVAEITSVSANPALMIVDHVLDPQNLGAIARSTAAAGLDGMVVADRRAAPLSAVAFKAAAGALEILPVAVVNSIADALSRLKKAGLWTVGLTSRATKELFGLELLTQPVAVVVGEEGPGLSRLVEERCEVTVSIPLARGIESLSSSTAAALAAYEVLRVRHDFSGRDHSANGA